METIKLSDIKPNPQNPRIITKAQFDKLVASIKRDPEYLSKRGIVVVDGIVLGGNQRYRAVSEAMNDPDFRKRIGAPDKNTIPADWIEDASDWSKEKQRRFVVIDNAPSGMAGDWDWDALANEFDIGELEAWGFDEGELFGDEEVPEENKDIDEEEMAETENECPKCGFRW